MPNSIMRAQTPADGDIVCGVCGDPLDNMSMEYIIVGWGGWFCSPMCAFKRIDEENANGR